MPPIVEETQLEGQARMTKKSILQSCTPLVLAILAIILGTAPTLECETVRFVSTDADSNLVLLAGPFQYRIQGADGAPLDWQTVAATSILETSSTSCVNYGDLGLDYETDGGAKTVWVLSILTPLVGACLVLKAFFRIACGATVPGFGGGACRTGGKRCLGICLVVVAVLQALVVVLIPRSSICHDNPSLQSLELTNPQLAGTFPTNGDDLDTYACELATGVFLQIAAAVLWVLAGVVTLASPEPVVVHDHPHQEQVVAYTQHPETGIVQESKVAIVKGRPLAPKSIDY